MAQSLDTSGKPRLHLGLIFHFDTTYSKDLNVALDDL